MTRGAAASALSIPPRTLDRWIERGAPGLHDGPPGSARYDVDAIRAWRAQRQAKIKPTLDLIEERAKLARVQRLHTNLKIRQLRRDLIPSAAADLLYSRIQYVVRAAVLRLPVDAVQRGIPREYESKLRDLAHAVLQSLAKAGFEDAESAA